MNRAWGADTHLSRCTCRDTSDPCPWCQRRIADAELERDGGDWFFDTFGDVA